MAARAGVPSLGPLAPYVSGFHDVLVSSGYASRSVASLLGLVGQLDVWLHVQGAGVDELSVSMLREFLQVRNAAGSRWQPTMKTFTSLLDFLRGQGVAVIATPPIGPTPGGVVCARFRRYLASERGLAAGTIDNYVSVAELFLSQLPLVEGHLDLAGVSLGDVTRFVTCEVSERSVGSAQNVVTGLRSLLGFLLVQGEIDTPLGQALPTVAGWSGNVLPRALTPAQVRQLLASCDRRRQTGRRNYAVLLLLVRLGLRAGEVAGLQLDDVDWRAGEIVVRGKGNCTERMPLPADVGDALTGYLQQPRANVASRAVFLRAHAPHGPLTPSGLADIVRTAGIRAGVVGAGAHRLRHTAATEMLRAGGSLPEVALVLRHRSTATTARYAKVDQAALLTVARPWPGAAR